MVVLCALGAAGYALPVPLVPGAEFVFGPIAGLLAACWLGVWPALTVAAVSGLVTLWTWGHPLGLPLGVAEAGTVALLYRLPLHGEAPPLALADGLFWLAAGLPLSLILFQGVLHLSGLESVLSALNLALNGVLNAALAGVLVILVRRRRRASVSLRELLFSVLLSAVLLPAFTLTVFQGRAAQAGMEAGISATLTLSAALARDALAAEQPPGGRPGADLGHAPSPPDAVLASVAERIRRLVPAAAGLTIERVDSAAPAPAGQSGTPPVRSLAGGLHRCLPAGRGPLDAWRDGACCLDQPLPGGAPGPRLRLILPAGPSLAAAQRTLAGQRLLLALICLAAVLGADSFSRRIAAPILRLAELCGGEPPAAGLAPAAVLAPTTLRETDRLVAAWRALLDSRVAAERGAAARALRRHNADLKTFSDLMAAYRPPHEQIRALLEFACQALGEDAAALGEIQETRYRLLTSLGAGAAGPVPAPGVVLPLGPPEQAAVRDLEGTGEAPPGARPTAGGCVLPPGSGFAAAAPLIRWTDAEGLGHLGVLSFGPGRGLAAASPEQRQVLALVGQAIASGLRERAVLDGLLAARQREIIGHLASGVAHDFNNLLGVLDINLDYLADLLGGTEGAGELGEVLEETRLAARHAKMVTAGLLSLSHGRRRATGPTPVSVVVERFTRTLARLLPAQIEVETHLCPGLVALADEALLQSTLLNLCINARDAMGGQGTLGIGLARIACPHPRPLTLGRLEPGDYVELTVSDTGSGMSTEVLGHIFQPLFSTKSSGRGTGLGLFMVREFVARCGGGVAVETAPGQGSRFRVYLPVAAAADAPRPGPAAARPRPPPVSPARVLLVDDDPGMRAVLCRTLETHGLKVQQAVDGVEALALLEGGTPCDLVLSDIVMPRMDGIELHRRLARAAPGLPVLLMTADDHQSVQAAGLPVDTVILYKPLVTGILLARIQERLPRRD